MLDGETIGVIAKRTLNERYSLKENQRYKSLNVGLYAQARYLVEKFEKHGCNDASNCFNYFVKCFQNLSEDMIWSIYENSVNNPKIHSPIKYFIASCRNQMR